MAKKKKIVILSGTRAEFGKLKPLAKAIEKDPRYEVHLFVTGMHMLEKYGGTAREILREFPNVYLYNNQAFASSLDIVLSNTINGFSHYVGEIEPDLIIVHGDRAEALAGAIVGSLNNILVAHVEGGELSGTIDELIRHSVSKLAHIHFVANDQAKKRLIQMGEKKDTVYVIGSPDIDIMFSKDLPSKDDVLKHYEIPYQKYAILAYHPVTTELGRLGRSVKALVDAVLASKLHYVGIYPNNDPGSSVILAEYKRLEGLPRVRLFPSIQFEKFLVLLKNSLFIIGNSSSGIREAPIYAVPTINLGSRQKNRFHHHSIFNIAEDKDAILKAIRSIVGRKSRFTPSFFFGKGKSAQKFKAALDREAFWKTETQKQFLDL